ncbi:DUF1320 domain-containing protein [Gluconacetobacter azotocaptans]|uniref:gp436 family protein n=1 Tax=Gluconacetobacter azotocaptans TaxID=142834 RepID=UPI00195A50C1|nr:DUF1320 domain-containing protein [Gluconacetobacter azotocaptans]MBM9400377.1 DUF1320 domain-containing protein [Gluconacetobacter azotocaptans]
MAYAVVQDLIDRFGEDELIAVTTQRGQPRETIDVARVGQAIGEASDLIDSYLRRRYTLPLTNPSANIVRVCCVIARYDLNATSDVTPTEQMGNDRKMAIAWLGDIASGKVTLDGAVPANTSTTFSRIQTRRAAYPSGCL